jgi:hypothetical protein
MARFAYQPRYFSSYGIMSPSWKDNLMEDRITIIEGPTPLFEPVQDGWALGLNETNTFSFTAVTRLRTYNGPALVERCYRRWNQNQPINLHYRDDVGLEATAPILAARSIQTDDGQVLLLWVHVERHDLKLEINADDSDDDELDLLE